MALTERDRRELFEGLEETLGPQLAETLMELLPNEPASQLVTIPYFQTEMQSVRSDLGSEMAELRTELKTEMAGLRTELKTEMADLRTELMGEIVGLRGEVRVEMSDMRSEMRTTMNRWAIGISAGNTIAVVTALLT